MAQVNNRKFNFNNLKILQWNANPSYLSILNYLKTAKILI